MSSRKAGSPLKKESERSPRIFRAWKKEKIRPSKSQKGGNQLGERVQFPEKMFAPRAAGRIKNLKRGLSRKEGQK